VGEVGFDGRGLEVEAEVLGRGGCAARSRAQGGSGW
jgi:hypothetical protein